MGIANEEDSYWMQKILIVEDHPILVYGLQLMIEKEEGFEVSGVVNTKDQALDLLESMGPASVVIDISLKYNHLIE